VQIRFECRLDSRICGKKLKPVRKQRLETRVQITSKNLQKYSHITLTSVKKYWVLRKKTKKTG